MESNLFETDETVNRPLVGVLPPNVVGNVGCIDIPADKMTSDPDIDHFGEDIPLGDYDKNAKNQKRIKDGTSKSTRRNQVDFSQQVRTYWKKKGYDVERMEGWRAVNEKIVKADFGGFADWLMRKKGEPLIWVQVCSKNSVREHLRKMLGPDPDWQGRPRRANVDRHLGYGDLICIMHFSQPAGFGTSWVKGIEWLTPELIADIDAGRRTKRV